ncbi:MAG TPA: BTAD domain-containing putative transcriptional regulator, partial [Ktedonobacteraceae bacterium]|nr:BTAD domain-containing putative transcriptional regulator [Ktedonobacteraceae bacterium]
MAQTLHIHLLGDFLLMSDEIPVTTINVPRLQSLLAYLVLHRTAPQARSHLAFLLWPDSTEAQAFTNLRKLLYQLRQALPDADNFLHADKHSLSWQSSPHASWTLDVVEFEQAVAQAEQADRAKDTTVLCQACEQALRLYRGDLLPSCYDEWILPERERLRQMFFHVAEHLITLLEQERDYDAAITIAQLLLRHDPLREETYRQLMRFYALRGDRAAALRIYHTCVSTLERELAATPSEATRRAYESLLQVDAATPPESVPAASRGTGVPLIGRKQEWLQLQDTWRKAVSGKRHMLVLSGEAGIGKTRLAEELLAWAGRQGVTTAGARCYAAQGRLAYAPVTAWLHEQAIQNSLSALDNVWLAEVARLLPDLLMKRSNLPRPRPMTEGWQRQHFFEALARALLEARQPLLLLLDDLQWCDDETLEWLHYFLFFAQDARLLLIATVRSEEILPGHPLIAFLATLQRDGLVTETTLKPLSTAETTSLAEHVVGHQLPTAMTDTLYRETEGNPLFVVETLRTGTLEPSIGEQRIGGASLSLLTPSASTLPPTVQAVLSTRLAQLSPTAREVANVAAVIGREFAFAVLARAGGEDEDAVVLGLDELWQRRIVREQGLGATETYDFTHDKLREQAYNSLSPAHRRLLHRRVAAAFETVYAADLDAVSGQIAAHYERANLPEKAIPYYQRAAEVAMRIYANSEAITVLQRAVNLLDSGSLKHMQQEKQWEVAVKIYTRLGQAFSVAGRYEEERELLHRAAAYVPTDAYLWRARLQRMLADTWMHISDNPQDALHNNARQAFQEAERLLEQVSDKSSPEWRHEWIELQFNQMFPIRIPINEFAAMIEKVQPVVEQYGTPQQRGQLFLATVVRDTYGPRFVVSEETVARVRKMLAVALRTGDKDAIGFVGMSLGICLLGAGHLDEAEEQFRTSVRLAEEMGNSALLIRSLTFLPFIYRRRGQVEEVRSTVAYALSKSQGRNISILTGQRAWLAWRDGNMIEAEAYARAFNNKNETRADPPDNNLFHWVGLWPLIGV